jgi:hypothetical protein
MFGLEDTTVNEAETPQQQQRNSFFEPNGS